MRHLMFMGLALLCQVLPTAAQDSLKVGDLQEIVVTGTGTQHRLKDAPVHTEVISRRDLEQYGTRSLEDILGGLSSSFAFSEDDMGSQMQMNGLGNAYILILVDGKRLHGDNGGQNDLGLIDPARIERIEIVRGASSALYGSDAIAGVINIITRKPAEGFLVENETRGGSYKDLRQHNTVGLTFGRVQSLTNFHFRHSDGWQNTGEEDPTQLGGRIITDSQNKTVNKNQLWQVSERLSWRPIDGMEVYADGMLYHKRIYRPNGKYAMADVHGYDLSYDDVSASAGWSWALEKGHRLSADVTWNRHGYYYDYTSEKGWLVESDNPAMPLIYFAGDRALQADQRRTMAQLKGIFELPHSNCLSVGYDFRYDWLKAPLRIDSSRATDWTQAIYAQDEWNPLKWLNITGGLRLDHNQQFGLHLTPKLSAMVSLGDFKLRASWSQGFKSPTPKEQHYRYVREMGGTRLFLGNTDLKPQTSNYFSLNGEYTMSKVSVSVTGYYNKVKDMINLLTIPAREAPAELILQYDPAFVRQYRNLEDAYTYGVDVTLKWNITREIAIGGGYSYLEAQGRVYDEETAQLRELTIDGTAHHKGNFFATWRHLFKDVYRLGIGLYGRASSTRYYENFGNGKAYHIWRLNTTHDFEGRALRSCGLTLRAELGVDNIFNYVDRTPHLRHLGTTTPGTTIYAAVVIRFNKGTKIKDNSKHSALKNNYNNEDD
ncbi:MAG: TonB-dependent receptor [Bacteroidaceae bacterium]|nr:TonB-dependent receptor [Bacteroidaceae bacterium]